MRNVPNTSTPRSAHPLPGAFAACRDERGASILLALFYFLVCAVVGAVVLTAATVTTGQLVALEKSQQAYYSVSSAAELLRDSIEGSTCESKEVDGSVSWIFNFPDGRGGLEPLLREMVAHVSDMPADGTAIAVFDMTFSGVDDQAVNESVLVVRVTATMQSDYALRFALRPKDYTEAVGDYRITLDIPAALLHGVDEVAVDRITWERAIIGKPLQVEGGAGA